MTLRPPENVVSSRPDGAQIITGREGIPVKQDVDGTQIQRLGIAGADADWGPETVDLPDQGDYKIAEPGGVGGTRSSSGIVRSESGLNCSVVYVWKSESDEYNSVQEARDSPDAVVQEPGAIQTDTEHVIQAINTKSDNCEVWITDESAEGQTNTVAFTLNFH
jgi:hypothetical protein